MGMIGYVVKLSKSRPLLSPLYENNWSFLSSRALSTTMIALISPTIVHIPVNNILVGGAWKASATYGLYELSRARQTWEALASSANFLSGFYGFPLSLPRSFSASCSILINANRCLFWYGFSFGWLYLLKAITRTAFSTSISRRWDADYF